MESKVLSIIIPVYNAEKYIPNLMEKFVVQDLSNVEIILVDDGSKDNSLRICQEYADRNENIVVIHQENRGASEARNTGIHRATGKYITFVDSDDDIATDYIQIVCAVCQREMTDLIQFDAYIKKDNDVSRREFIMSEGKATLIQYFECVLNQQVNEPWDKAYRSEIIHANKICFPKEMTIGEDISLTIAFLKYVNSVYICHEAVYYYERNSEGICANAKLKHLLDLEVLYDNMKHFINDLQLDEKTLESTNATMVKSVFRVVGWIMDNGEKKNNVCEYMEKLSGINKLLTIRYQEKSVEIRRWLLKNRLYYLVAVITNLKK